MGQIQTYPAPAWWLLPAELSKGRGSGTKYRAWQSRVDLGCCLTQWHTGVGAASHPPSPPPPWGRRSLGLPTPTYLPGRSEQEASQGRREGLMSRRAGSRLGSTPSGCLCPPTCSLICPPFCPLGSSLGSHCCSWPGGWVGRIIES